MDNKQNRPTLNDPAEFALIKQIYFKDDRPLNEDTDPLERLERMESRYKHKQKNSR